MHAAPAGGRELRAGQVLFFLRDALGARERDEHRVVSVLCVDLVEFTARSEGTDPEDFRARLRPDHARVKSEIDSLGGTIEKFISDTLMAESGALVRR